MKSTLAQQQQQFAQAIRNHDKFAPDHLLRLTPQGKPAHFHIYSTGYQIRLGEALKENYPILSSVLGDESFTELAAAFLSASPSIQPSIRWFGHNLASFVQHNPATLSHPALHDLIRMEWALSTAFDAPDAIALQVSEFMQLAPQDWPLLTLTIHPSVHLLAMEWNIEPLWSTLSADPNADTQPPDPLPHNLLVWRHQQTNHWRSVQANETQLLRAVIAGMCFADLCAIAAESATPVDVVASYLRLWVDAGLVAGMSCT